MVHIITLKNWTKHIYTDGWLTESATKVTIHLLNGGWHTFRKAEVESVQTLFANPFQRGH